MTIGSNSRGESRRCASLEGEREPRLSTDLQVRIWGMADGRPFWHKANLRNISGRGALVAGLAQEISVGEMFGLQFKDKKARFRVVWIRNTLSTVRLLSGIRAGLQLLAGQNCPWQCELARAVEIPKTAAPLELGQSQPFPFQVGGMYSAYLRGEAYLLARQGKEAAAEFQKIIDHRGIVLNFPLDALARLGLARSYALQGDSAKARIAYLEFLNFWKDADPDIPILKQAKAEYAKLQ